MPKTDNRPNITLACTECKRRNYVTVKNRQNDRDRIELMKYCRWDRKPPLHRETRCPRPPHPSVSSLSERFSVVTLPNRMARTSASSLECTPSFVRMFCVSGVGG